MLTVASLLAVTLQAPAPPESALPQYEQSLLLALARSPAPAVTWDYGINLDGGTRPGSMALSNRTSVLVFW